jgi:integrase/recombinase XerD
MKGCRPFTADEAEAVIKSFWGRYKARDRALFILGIKSGFRISEMLSLKIGDIIHSGRMVDKVSVRRENMKKKTEGRTVRLHPYARKALKVWLAQLRESGYMTSDDFVFQSNRGGNRPISRVQAWRILNSVAKDNGFTGKVGTHSMRKTFADRVYDALDRDLVKLQKALGHRNMNSTVQYLGFREEEIDEAIMNI